jgi:hypothetical protein
MTDLRDRLSAINAHRVTNGHPPFPDTLQESLHIPIHEALIRKHAPFGNDPWAIYERNMADRKRRRRIVRWWLIGVCVRAVLRAAFVVVIPMVIVGVLGAVIHMAMLLALNITRGIAYVNDQLVHVIANHFRGHSIWDDASTYRRAKRANRILNR